MIRAAKEEAKQRPALIAQGTTPIYAQGWITARRWEDAKLNVVPVTGADMPEDATLKDMREMDASGERMDPELVRAEIKKIVDRLDF